MSSYFLPFILSISWGMSIVSALILILVDKESGMDTVVRIRTTYNIHSYHLEKCLLDSTPYSYLLQMILFRVNVLDFL